MKRFWSIFFCLSLVLPMVAQEEELCIDGTLLFREDFGGNDPSDPDISMASVQGMDPSYHNSGNSLGSGNYTLRKEGWHNGIQWHWQDDHTYFGDKTRGYLLEVDGVGGAKPFYSKTIEGLCAGTQLTFSAYIVNVHYAGQLDYFGSRYVYPRMKFVLKDPETGAILAEKSTGDIQPDWRYGTSDTWKYARDNQLSAEWQLFGMNFTVPDGVESIQMFIYNDVAQNGSGNDFALDDIEIHLCAPPVTIEGEKEVCENGATTLTTNFTNDGTFAEPLAYKWWHSTDSITWTEISGFNGENLLIDAVQKSDSGWYKVAVSGDGNIESVNCRAVSEPFRLRVSECEPSARILSPDSVCPNDPCAFQIEITNENTLQGPLVYQWLYRSLEYPTEWRNVSGGTVRELQIASFQTQHVGWYKLYVAEAGKINNPDERIESEEFFVTFKKCEPDLCTDGTLLYKDDFGGNSPSDPRVGQVPVQGMSYRQLNNDSFGRMGSGCYLVTKSGYCNGDTAAAMRNYGYIRTWDSQWILQDDHTYMGDYSRGYFVEIDGEGGQSPFYSTTISSLCPGSKLTFSAHVVNVAFFEWVQKMYRTNRSYIYPRLKFVLKNPVTGAVLAEQSTGDIQPDITKSWNILLHESAEWQLVGMNFTVPEGVEAITLTISNNTTGYVGNDFALDDIEIHLCLPPVTVSGESEVCLGSATSLTADFTNDGTLAEPLEYKWWHSEDSLVWTELPGFIGPNPTIDAVHKADSGWYKVAVSGAGNIEATNCRALSDPFRLSVKDCPSPEPELCIDGILLFREDFGGNDPSDPRVGTNPVPGMSYTQATTDVLGSMGGGKYLVTKQGYCNGNGTSQWHLQDDHTYPNDKTRGYLLEIDGRGDNSAFYSTTIEELCEGSKLTFSAYVANVMTWGMYIGRPGTYAYPRLKFVLADPVTDAELAMYDTGDIPFDSAFIGDNMCWQQSVEWRLVGMNFTVPAGQNSIKLTIYNNATGSNGNDFAIDDIEIRLCAPPVAIEGETEVCTNNPTTLTANFSNDGTFAEPLAYKWWHSTDSITWTEISGFNGENLLIDAVQKSDSGWYKVAVSGDGNIESENCRAVSDPFLLKVNTCDSPCPEMVTVMVDTVVCDTLMPYRWRDTLFTEPATYEILYKDQRGCDSLLRVLTLNTQICCPEMVTITADTTVCDTLMPYRWRDTLFTEPATYEILYKDQRGCDSLLCILTLNTQICCPGLITITADTMVCDTLMPYRWRDTLFTEPATYEILYKDQRGCDSLLCVLTLNTQVCCPKMVTITVDTVVCDTLLPFTWTLRNQTFVFEHAEIQVLDIPHPKWTDCTDTSYILHLDTFHCEKLWPLIVNKYNWVLLLDNVSLARLLPGRTACAYQWYKNDAPIPGATDDDYSEQNELCGRFQLRIVLDNEQAIWSNILEIGEAQEELPVRVTIFNSWGMLVRENQVSHGVYLYRYEQGEKKWTEKKLIP